MRGSAFSINSLTVRVVLMSSLWALIAIAILGWVLVGMFRSNIDRSFNEVQLAQLYGLIAGVELTADGAGLIGAPDLGDANFRNERSGWYWQVSLIGPDGTPTGQRLSSPSLADETIPRLSLDAVPYSQEFTRRFRTIGPHGALLRVYEAEVALAPGTIALFQVAGNESGFQRTIRDYAGQIALLLSIFALGTVIINAAVILWGLRPLERIRRALGAIRDGRSQRLEGRFPDEIRPLADEMNALFDNNRRILDRARTQVGNLAHSLKTPLSVLQNEAGRDNRVDAGIVRQQTGSMQTQIAHYLDRARIAAQRESVVYRTDALAAAERLVRVMVKLNPKLDLALETDARSAIFAGEKEDFEEMLGNLLENACKWAASRVQVEITVLGEADNPGRLRLTVHDDGPGIAKDQRAQALRRGARLDETVPGTGLGLAIVLETVRSYGGLLELGDSPLGGLKVDMELPALPG